jgi:hypothetical protein
VIAKQRRQFVDRVCLGDFKDASASIIARPTPNNIVLYGEDNKLLQVTLFDTPDDLVKWKMSILQYMDFTKTIPNTAHLKISAAWCCDSSEMIYRTKKWLGLSHVNKRGVGMAGFVTLNVPPGLVLWPLRQFVLSPADLRGSWSEALKNWFTQVWAPTHAPYVERLQSSGMEVVLQDLYSKARVNCMSMNSDYYGVLVDPKTPPSNNPAAPVVATVLMALPPPLEDISQKSSVEDRNTALGINLYGLVGDLGGLLKEMQMEIMSGKEGPRGEVDAVFRPTSRLYGVMITLLGVVMVPRFAEEIVKMVMGPTTAAAFAKVPITGLSYYKELVSSLAGTTGYWMWWVASTTGVMWASMKYMMLISKTEEHLKRSPAEQILGK